VIHEHRRFPRNLHRVWIFDLRDDLFVRDLRIGRDSFLRKLGRWIRNLIDTLFGLG
jgi:hypothetical protein